MHDIRAIRAEPAAFDAALARRGLAPVSDAVLAMDAARRAALSAQQEHQARRNALAKEIGLSKRAGTDTATLEAEATRLRDDMAALEQTAAALDASMRARLEVLPNTLDPDVPDGADETGERRSEAKAASPRTSASLRANTSTSAKASARCCSRLPPACPAAASPSCRASWPG